LDARVLRDAVNVAMQQFGRRQSVDLTKSRYATLPLRIDAPHAVTLLRARHKRPSRRAPEPCNSRRRIRHLPKPLYR
jgi:hypothetical protein